MYENSLIGRSGTLTTMAEHFRPHMKVLVRIAKVFEHNTSVNKTHLHFASRTDWKSFEKYFRWLLDNNYITHKIDGKVHKYQLTFLGRERLTVMLNLHDNITIHESIIVY